MYTNEFVMGLKSKLGRANAELAAAREDRTCENTDCSNTIDGNQNPGVCLPCWNRVAVENTKLRALIEDAKRESRGWATGGYPEPFMKLAARLYHALDAER